jgi:hypothetical protein
MFEKIVEFWWRNGDPVMSRMFLTATPFPVMAAVCLYLLTAFVSLKFHPKVL